MSVHKSEGSETNQSLTQRRLKVTVRDRPASHLTMAEDGEMDEEEEEEEEEDKEEEEEDDNDDEEENKESQTS